MNWEFILKYLPMYEKAAWLTLRIGLLGIVFAIIVGFVCSTIQYYKVPVRRQNSAEIHHCWYSYSLFTMDFRRSESRQMRRHVVLPDLHF